MKRIKKGLSILLVLCMVLSFVPFSAFAITMGSKPADGTTTGNPFPQGTGGSNSFRIPAMVTLNDGTIVAAADARWNTTYDGGGLDTIVSYSTDNGANWNYTFANYLGDNGNTYNGSSSTAFIDPALATDGETVYMLCDLYPYGIALNGSGNTAPSTSVGLNDDGTLKLSNDGGSSYNYYLKDGKIYNSGGNVVDGYTVDAYFNITGTDGTDTNLFFSDSPYQVVRTGFLYLTKSTDGGKNWSEPMLLNLKTSSEQVCLVGPGRGLVAGGKIIFPVYSYNGSSDSQRMGFIYSEDGIDWSRVNSDISWSSESAVVELSDGTLRFFYRNGNSRLYYVDYSWETESWGAAVNTGIATNSNTQISAISYSKTVDDKQVILVSCPTGSGSSGSSSSSASARLNGKIFVGLVNSDNTMDWSTGKSVSLTSQHSTTNYFMYSCLTELSDGSVAILYEDNESAWGTGDNYYYQMSYTTIDASSFGLTFDEVTDEDIYVDSTDIIINFGASAYGKVTITAVTPEVLGDRPYVAYDISVANFKGTATVTIPIPAGTFDSAKTLHALYIDDNGNIADVIDGTYDSDANTFTFETNHFSTYAVVDGTDIILTVGESYGPINDTTDHYTTSKANPEGIVDVDLGGSDGQEGGVTYTEASVTCNTLISSNSNNWTAVSGYYYKADDGNYYPVYAKRSRSGSGSDRTYNYTWGYSTTSSTSNVTQIGTQSTTNTGDSPNITVYTQSTTEAVEAYTTITFTALKAGYTEVTVGSTTYYITVEKAEKTVNLAVGGTATYTDASTGTPVVADTAVATVTLSGGNLTITGVAEGTTTVTTDTTVYTVTVSEGTEISIKENETTTISVTLDDGQYVKWSSADSNYAGVAGKYDTTDGAYTNEAILAGQNVTDSPVVVTATIYNADGTVAGTQKWLVTVTEGDADTNTSSKGIYFNIDTIEHCTVYYSINGGELIPVNGTGVTTGNWTGNGTYTGHFNIMFFAAPDEGYALTYMSISGSADQYYTLTNGNPDGTGSDAWPFVDAAASTIPSSSSDSAWKTVNGSLHGFRWALLEGNMTIDQMKVLFSNAIALGCDGVTTITKNSTEGMGSSSSPTVCKFVAQKLPTVEKVITSVTHADGTVETYYKGMTVKIGDTITYTITVTRYATNADYGTITYDNESLTDALTGNNGISNPDMGTSTTSDQTYTYTTTLTLTKDNFGTVVKGMEITNEVEFSCTYSSNYSAGSLDTKASAVADVTVEIPKYVVDFGLPLIVDLSSSTDTTGTGAITDVSDGTYGKAKVNADGKGFTYTPHSVIQGIDYVTFTYEFTPNDGSGTKEYQYTVAIYPATTVYYEEGFASYTGTGWTGTDNKGTGSQDAHIAGSALGNYGYDVAYNAIGASNGTQAESTTKGDNCTFTFTGTGVTVYANTTTSTGVLFVQIKNSEGTTVKMVQVKTHMANGESSATTGQAVEAYNVPVVSVLGLDHGTYSVHIYHVVLGSDEVQPVYIDGFRVYGTLKDEPDFYATDMEDEPIFIEMRDEVLTGLGVTKDSDSIYADQLAKDLYSQVFNTAYTNGAVVLSSYDVDGEWNVKDLLDNGPKNEIYLRNGEALVFKVTTNRVVQIGLKALNASTTYTINGGEAKTLSSSTDMFYTVLDKAESKSEQTIVITNTGDGILSITDLKICDDPNASLGALTEEDLTRALLSLGFMDKPDPTPDPEPTDPTEPEPTDPTEPAEPDPTEPEATDPTEPEPTDPTEPAEPDPTEPEATDPTDPEPTAPADPEPTAPAPAPEPEPEPAPEPSFLVRLWNAIVGFFRGLFNP